ncbi:MAG TPA: helix-turn-helix domain-containing protein, partial [Candidatus Nanoarchaeia archaeon]|nr:helix-turn-helix domain-containing protein [Candidatus Nanoarchaeia archaeon]
YSGGMDQKILQRLGFSKNQAKVYITLINSGSATAGELAVKSMVHRSNVYDALDQLVEQGLVSYIYKGSKKIFMPSNPENIKENLKEKEKALDEILPLLKAKYIYEEKAQARIYEGLQGIRTILNDFLREKKEILAFGVVKDTHRRIGSISGIFHKQRIKNKIPMRHIHDAESRNRIAYLNSMPYTESRYIDQKDSSPATTTICGDKVAFYIWPSKAKADPENKEALSVVIKSKVMADSYRRYFEFLWKQAKK